MGTVLVILIVMAAVAVATVALGLWLRSRRTVNRDTTDDASAAADSHPRRPIEPPVPMTGLESALAQATDRSGRPMREVIDDETTHVDDLRVPDDTGPLLRRALDHVAEPREPSPDTDTATAGDPDTSG